MRGVRPMDTTAGIPGVPTGSTGSASRRNPVTDIPEQARSRAVGLAQEHGLSKPAQSGIATAPRFSRTRPYPPRPAGNPGPAFPRSSPIQFKENFLNIIQLPGAWQEKMSILCIFCIIYSSVNTDVAAQIQFSANSGFRESRGMYSVKNWIKKTGEPSSPGVYFNRWSAPKSRLDSSLQKQVSGLSAVLRSDRCDRSSNPGCW